MRKGYISRLTRAIAAAIVCLAMPVAARVAPSTSTATQTVDDSKIATNAVPYLRVMPTADQIAVGDEKRVLSELLAQLVGATDQGAILAAGDSALAKTARPSKLRGYIQFVRANGLFALDRNLDAIDAIEESVRLLPGYSGPLIAASSMHAYANRPEKAAEYLMRAIETDPATVRTIDDYEVGNLLRRLSVAGDARKTQALSERLLEIGWLGSRLGSRSSLALQAIKSRIANGDEAAAKALVTKLVVPEHSRSLLMMNAYSSLWPAIEEWAGKSLERQWGIYLREARDRWAAGKGAVSTQDYVAALTAASDYQTIVRDVLPQFAKADKLEDYDLLFSTHAVATALARLGRWDEANALFVKAQSVWPLGEHANALNIAANQAEFLLNQGKAAEAEALMDVVIKDAQRWGSQINVDAIAGMHHYKACILHEVGRDAEAGVAMATAALAERGASLADLHICMGDSKTAKRTLIKALDDDSTRDGVVAFMQTPSEPALNTAYLRKVRAAEDALRQDPELIAATAKFGRILSFTSDEGARASLSNKR